MAPKHRYIGLVGLCFAAVVLVGVSLDGRGDRRTEALGAVSCLTPPCVVNGETVSPHISFHYSQDVQAFPHPLTQKAIDKAEVGNSMALDDQDLSVKHKGQISRVKRVTKRTRGESEAQMEKSRVALWKTVGQLRARLADYRRRLVKAKANMMARDNYLSARVESLQTALGRAKVALTRRLGYIKVHAAVVSHMKGPKGKDGADGKAGDQGPRGYRGARGGRGPPGDKGKTGPAGWPGRDGAPGAIGPMGDMGIPGPRGFQGQNGPVGRPGKMGPPGKPGVGITGTRGPTGPVGPPGPPGAMGKPGVPGLSIPGPSGRPGMPGQPGQPGVHGAHGPAGPPGTAGAPGTVVHL